MQTKKKQLITGLSIIVLVAIIVLIAQFMKPVDYCNLDLKVLLMENKTGKYIQPKDVTRQLLSQYLTAQKNIPKCKDSGLIDYAITSIGDPTFMKDGFMIDVKFDFEPVYPKDTIWATPETTRDGAWVRGKSMRLGIRQASTTSMLVP